MFFGFSDIRDEFSTVDAWSVNDISHNALIMIEPKPEFN